jgi:hypothetical protein
LVHYPAKAGSDLAGKLAGLDYWHPCRDGGLGRGWIPLDAGDNGWQLECLEPLTISPSLLCTACQHHGHIRGGRWEPA